MYVTVIIGVDAVVIQRVSVRGDLNHHRYNKRVGFTKFLGVLCEIDVRGVQIDFVKV